MLVKPSLPAVLHVARHMREIDRREVFSLRWTDSEEALAEDLMRIGGPAWIATAKDREPVYAFGLAPHRPGVWTVWGFGTDRWPEVMAPVTRFIKRVLLPAMLIDNAHRVDCVSLLDKVAGHRWLEYLGAERESLLKEYGRNREDYFMYVWR